MTETEQATWREIVQQCTERQRTSSGGWGTVDIGSTVRSQAVLAMDAEIRRLRAELQWWKDEMWRLDPDSPGQAQKIRELMRNQKWLCDALRPMLLDGRLGSALNPNAPNDMLLPTPTTVGERRQATALLCEVEGE